MNEYTLLICNGYIPDAGILASMAEPAVEVVCADGGANAAAAAGIEPDMIIGDFDSIRPEVYERFQSAGVQFREESDQSSTDFEKALRYMRRRHHRTVVIFGLTGGLLDHTLGNFSILLRYTGSFRLIAFDAHYRIDFINSSMEFRSRPGDRVSVIPLQPALEVSYSGLKYPMREETLACGVREGTCNEALGEAFGIETSGGVLAVFRPLSAELRERLAGDNPLTL